MRNKINIINLVGDFETTSYDGQEFTEVWATALTAVGNTDINKVVVHNCLKDFMNYIISLKSYVRIYMHNLKFDGTFIMDYLLKQKNFKPYLTPDKKELMPLNTPYKLPNGTFTYMINDMGVWYSIIIRYHNQVIEFRDSLKLLPFSVEKIGKDFKTKWKKSKIEYTGYRQAGGIITEKEENYIKRDVLVVSEALKIMFDIGLNKSTIGSCCLNEWKQLRYNKGGLLKYKEINELFRNDFPLLDKKVEDFIRSSYKGGWCYVHKPGIANFGYTADINSSYPYNMHSSSGNIFPVGQPHYFNRLEEIPKNNKKYFVKIRFGFELKKDKLPCLQIKGNPLYKGTEWLKTSKVSEFSFDTVELVLTDIDYELVKECYDLFDVEILGGYWFDTVKGLFDDYIDKWIKIKKENTGAIRQIAKLMLNNLYGKFAASTRSDYKVFYIKDNAIASYIIEDENQEPGFIPIGSIITAYARNYVIRTALKDVYNFCYADTDSIHCTMSPHSFNFNIDDKELGAWDIEAIWTEAFFSGQKRYIEHTINNDYIIKCAGMTNPLRKKFASELKKGTKVMSDFTTGLVMDGVLKARIIPGGTVLKETTYIMR